LFAHLASKFTPNYTTFNLLTFKAKVTRSLTALQHWLIFTRESRMLRASLPSSGRLSVRPSVCPSHSWAVSKRCKLGSRNLYYGLPQGL